MRRFARLAALTAALFVTPLATQIAATQTAAAQTQEIATVAGGCYWCTEADFDKVDGVLKVTPGFMGGKTANPTYKSVAYQGGTGHTEVVQIVFDPSKVSYARLIEIFWRTIDPVDAGGQFCDRGDSYRSEIFYHSDAQKTAADASKAKLTTSARFKQPIATAITAASTFTPSDRPEDHGFYKKSPGHYYSYRQGCGRDARLKQLWGAEAGGKIATQ